MLRIRGTESRPFYLGDDHVDVFADSHKSLPASHHTQDAFAVESLARYFEDPERCASQLCSAKDLYDKLGFAALAPDHELLAELQRAQLSAPAVNVDPDPFAFVEKCESFNALRGKASSRREACVVELDGSDDQGADVLAAGLADAFRGAELVRVSARTFADENKLAQVLGDGVASPRGAVLYLDELGGIAADACGFELLARHVERFGGQAPVILRGSAAELDEFKKVLPTATRGRFSLDSLTPAQIAENVVRRARSEGFTFSTEAIAACAARVSGGGLAAALGFWRNVKDAQQARILKDVDAARRELSGVTRITTKDVGAARLPSGKTPEQRLRELPGLDHVVSRIDELIAQLEDCPTPDEIPRLNILFVGNPGTGKTTVAELLTEMLYARRLLKRNVCAKPLVSDVVKDPDASIKKLFETNKGGVIFFDELQQLADSPDGRLALRRMIPYLGSPHYRDTVVIGAGYLEEIKALLREHDKGGEGRFPVTIGFEDYDRKAAGAVLDYMLAKKRLEPGDARDAALARIDRERRCMMHFANARTIDGIIEEADRKRLARRGKAIAGDGPVAGEPRTFVAEDFVAPPAATVEQAWAAIDAIPGNRKLKQKLRDWADAMVVARSYDEDPFRSISTNIALAGPAGSYADQWAKAITMLFAAYDVLPTIKMEELTGPDLQGKFVGHNSDAVMTPYKNAWGGTVFINHIGGLANAGGSFKGEVVSKWLDVLDKKKRSVATIVAGSPDEVAAFFGMDAQLAGAFVVLATEPLGASDVVDEVVKQLADAQRELDVDDLKKVEAFALGLAGDPTFSGSGDVEKLVKAIMRQQAAELAKLINVGKRPDSPRRVLSSAVDSALQEVGSDRIAGRRVEEDASLAVASETRALEKAREPEAGAVRGRRDAVLTAMQRVNQRLAERYANDPRGLLAAQQDATSDYVKALAEELGVASAEAVTEVAAVRTAITEGIKIRRLEQRFVYHCPFCGGIDSPTCDYRGMPLDWKIANSLRKPWTETVEEILGAKT